MKNNIKIFLAFIIIIFISNKIFDLYGYLVIDDINSMERIMMHDLYNTEKNIDILFAGSSHVFLSIDPTITDDTFGKYTFNAGSGSQNMDGSLAIIKEAIKRNDIKEIYLDMYFGVAENIPFTERTDLTNTYIISDYMSNSWNRFSYLLNASSKEYYIDSFIPARRYWEKIFDFKYISNLFNQKQTSQYKNYETAQVSKRIYKERGYQEGNDVANRNSIWNGQAYGLINTNTLKEETDYKKTLQSIVNLCKKKNIKLTLIMIPMLEDLLLGKQNYGEYTQLLKDFADLNEIKYYDFNLSKNSYFDNTDVSNFYNIDHINTAGAKKFTKLFSDVVTGKISEDEVFYKSFNEKLSAEEPKTYAVSTNGSSGYIISNRSDELEYKIVEIVNGKEEIIQDYSNNKKFPIKLNEENKIKVYSRKVGNSSILDELSYDIKP